jgi:hypothetical protein
MSKPLIANHDAQTGLSEVREMTDAEHADWLTQIESNDEAPSPY